MTWKLYLHLFTILMSIDTDSAMPIDKAHEQYSAIVKGS